MKLLDVLDNLFAKMFNPLGMPVYAQGFDLKAQAREPEYNTNILFKKGGSTVVEKPVYTPPPAAPTPASASTQAEAVTPEEEEMKKKEAQKSGAKSLQIPVVAGAGGGGTGTVGTGT